MKRRILLIDDQRGRLAVKGKVLGAQVRFGERNVFAALSAHELRDRIVWVMPVTSALTLQNSEVEPAFAFGIT